MAIYVAIYVTIYVAIYGWLSKNSPKSPAPSSVQVGPPRAFPRPSAAPPAAARRRRPRTPPAWSHRRLRGSRCARDPPRCCTLETSIHGKTWGKLWNPWKKWWILGKMWKWYGSWVVLFWGIWWMNVENVWICWIYRVLGMQEWWWKLEKSGGSEWILEGLEQKTHENISNKSQEDSRKREVLKCCSTNIGRYRNIFDH